LHPSRIQEAFRRVAESLVNGGVMILVEDWALDPKDDIEAALYRLRQIFQEQVGPVEYHQPLQRYVEWLEAIGLHAIEIEQGPRSVDISVFSHLKGAEARYLRGQLAGLQALTVDMAICVAKKPTIPRPL
jgi:hypothetical protein